MKVMIVKKTNCGRFQLIKTPLNRRIYKCEAINIDGPIINPTKIARMCIMLIVVGINQIDIKYAKWNPKNIYFFPNICNNILLAYYFPKDNKFLIFFQFNNFVNIIRFYFYKVKSCW